MSTGIEASIVIPTRGRPELLRRCLDAVLDQDVDPSAYEVIVADDGPDDMTRAAVNAVARASLVAVRYVAVGGISHGPAAARNAGWRAARGRILAFTDDDCVPARSWLRAGLDAFLDGVQGAWGQIIVPLPDEPTDYQRDTAGLVHAEFVTANCFYLRGTVAAIGGFDERFTAAWREDSDLFFTLLDRRSPLVYAPGAIVIHPPRAAQWGVSLRQQRKAMFNALLYRKHRQRYRQRIQRTPPLHYYGIVVALVAACALFVAGLDVIAIACAACWVMLTARFCIARLRGTSHQPGHVAEMLFTSVLIPPLAIYWRLRGAVRYRVLFL
jgi:glycosyltransferase involved in cell wall biosynthesis